METVAATPLTTPIVTRLIPGPNRSAAQPNAVMPIIANTIVPVLKSPNTRAIKSFGVRSCSDAETSGVMRPEVAPMTMIKAAANTICSLSNKLGTAPAAIAAATAIIHMRPHTVCCGFQISHTVVARIPALKDDHSQPNATDPTWRSRSPMTGNS